MHQKFVLFGYQHLIVIALTFAVPVALAFVMRSTRSQRFDAIVRFSFAMLLIGTWIAWYVLFITRGWLSLGNALPMNLCDWTTIAVIAACFRRSPRAYELAYFWALAGTMQGLVTPDVNFSFPEPQFVVFLLGHGAIIAAVIYLTFGSGLRPQPASILRVAGWSLVYAAAAALTDWLLGVNYGFFRAKPGHATIFDFMPAWPGYIPEMITLGIVTSVVLYAPWFVADMVRKIRKRPV
jgi:hypothetical integral membrane protein (TIGR02206 family)